MLALAIMGVKSRTEDVQERVLQTEELVTVGSHCVDGVVVG